MNDDGQRGQESRRAGPADDADGDDEYGRGGGSGVYDVRGQLTRARGKSSRIFADECHTIIMDVGYRRDLEASKELHRYDCPVILLTATLQIRIER